MEFFVDESCGSCVPCRAMTPVMKNMLEKIIEGKGSQKDIEDLQKYGKIMKAMNRCGLGQTSFNPIITTIETFVKNMMHSLNRKVRMCMLLTWRQPRLNQMIS